jgi:redox-sensitive bicupin YhaK (pirin superfamily)
MGELYKKRVSMSRKKIKKIKTYKSEFRFLLVSGRPIREPVTRYGSIVMNTRGRAENRL